MNTDLFDRQADIHGQEMSLRWRDQVGNVYRVQQMSSSHIRNSMKYLLRQAQEMWDYKTVAAFEKVVESELDLASSSDRALVEYMFEHLRMKPTEWVRRMVIMYAFHHELQRRRHRLEDLKEEGTAIFEFPT